MALSAWLGSLIREVRLWSYSQIHSLLINYNFISRASVFYCQVLLIQHEGRAKNLEQVSCTSAYNHDLFQKFLFSSEKSMVRVNANSKLWSLGDRLPRTLWWNFKEIVSWILCSAVVLLVENRRSWFMQTNKIPREIGCVTLTKWDQIRKIGDNNRIKYCRTDIVSQPNSYD